MRDDYSDRVRELERETATRANAEYTRDRAVEGLESAGKEAEKRDEIIELAKQAHTKLEAELREVQHTSADF